MQESTEGFELFVSIVDEGSISAASRATGVPRETLSRGLARLEERLGVRLVHRDTRSLALSRAGEALYARARPLVIAAREAEAAVRQLDDVPRGLLRVSVPPGAGGAMADLFVRFFEQFPEVRIEVLSTSRHVELVAEQIDVAVRAGAVRDSGLVARKLWSSDLGALASRAYLDRRGRPSCLDDLAAHDCLLGYDAAERPARSWPTRDGGSVPVTGRLVSNDLGLLGAAAVAGQGIAMLPGSFYQDAMATGELEPVLPDVLGAPTSMSVVFVERRFMDPKVRAFVDHVSVWCETPGRLEAGGKP